MCPRLLSARVPHTIPSVRLLIVIVQAEGQCCVFMLMSKRRNPFLGSVVTDPTRSLPGWMEWLTLLT